MQEFINHLFDASGFPPRWLCGQWSQFHGWLYIGANLGIWAAYTSIPLLLIYFISRRKDIPFMPVFWLFAAFIYSCGTTHLMDAILFWWPGYRLAAVILFITAVISWMTVAALIPTIPKALALKSPRDLEHEIAERNKVEAELRLLNESLESLITKRTEDLELRTRQLEAANREMEAFSYSVSHDLRAPLRRVEHFSQFLRKNQANQLDAQGQDYLSRIHNNVQRMDHLIESLLRLSRLSRQELLLEPTDLSAIAREIAGELQEDSPERQVEFVIEPDVTVWADSRLLRQVLENLLDNAWKYTSLTPNGRIEFGRILRNDETVFFVKDNGVGLNTADSRLIFNPFTRLHKPEEFPGTGIGLATVQRIIARHGGNVWAEGQPGAGATFYFTLVNKDLESGQAAVS